MTRRGKLLGACRAAVAALPLLVAACYPRPETAYDAQQPSTRAVRNIGNFSEALRCMDDLFLAQGKRDIYITTAGIPDATGLILRFRISPLPEIIRFVWGTTAVLLLTRYARKARRSGENR